MEALLAKLYVDAQAREGFIADPEAYACAAGLDASSAASLRRIDRVGLAFAAASYARKRERHRRTRTGIFFSSVRRRLEHFLRFRCPGEGRNPI